MNAFNGIGHNRSLKNILVAEADFSLHRNRYTILQMFEGEGARSIMIWFRSSCYVSIYCWPILVFDSTPIQTRICSESKCRWDRRSKLCNVDMIQET